MKKKEKRMLIILAIVAILIIGVIYFLTRPKQEENIPTENTVVEEFVDVLEDGTKLNTSTKLSEMKTFEGLKFGNIQLTEKGSKTELIADVVNESGKDIDTILFDIILYDKEGNEIIKLGGIISSIKG